MSELSDREFLSPNRGLAGKPGWPYRRDGSWQGDLAIGLQEQPNKVLVHATRSTLAMPPRTHAQEMTSTINWFLNPASGASTQLIASDTELVRMLPDDWVAWHAKEHSFQAWSVELTQPNIWNEFEDGHYAQLASLLYHYQQLGVEPVWLDTTEWGDTRSGWVTHEESAQGRRDGKSDPGPKLDKARVVREVRALARQDDDITPETPEVMPSEEEEMAKLIQRVDGDERGGYYIVGSNGRRRGIKNDDELRALAKAKVIESLTPEELTGDEILDIPSERQFR